MYCQIMMMMMTIMTISLLFGDQSKNLHFYPVPLGDLLEISRSIMLVKNKLLDFRLLFLD